MENLYDIHCHILPGVDDGADSIEKSMEMLKMEFKDGVRNIIFTPHYRRRMFETPEDKILQQFLTVKKAASQVLPDLKLYLGCELHSNMDMIDMLQERKNLTLAGSSYVLTEFSNGDTASYIKERCYSLLSNGYDPILAHIERYSCMKNLDLVNELRQMGAKMQVNAESIIGKSGWNMKRYCRSLMKEDMLDFVGSDAHGTSRRAPRMGECAEYMEKKMGSAYTEQILIKNPSEIIGR